MAMAQATYPSAVGQCARKLHYRKKSVAKYDARALMATEGGRRRAVYRCPNPFCPKGGWLVGTTHGAEDDEG